MSTASAPPAHARFDADPTEVSVLVSPLVAGNCTILRHAPRFVQLPNGLLYVGSAGVDDGEAPPDHLHRVHTIARTSMPSIVIVIADAELWITYADDVPLGAMEYRETR